MASGSTTDIRVATFCLLLAPIATSQQTGKTLRVETDSGVRQIRCETIRATLRDDSDRPTATMQGFGYLGESPTQPVTFFWNGGPGLSSAILHTGFAAPRIADLVGGTGLSDNPRTLIDRTDLIYVDPVGTGFSRAIAPAEESDFFGVHEDADAAAQFVATVVAERGWEERPIYLCGESYGGVRVAAMLEPLRERGLVPAGLILISPALDWNTASYRDDTENWAIDTVDSMPTLAALTQADGSDPIADRRRVEAACQFALGPMLDAARAGVDIEDLPDGELRKTLHGFTNGNTRRILRNRDPYDARLRFHGARVGNILAGAKKKALRSIMKDTFDIESTGYLMGVASPGFAWRGTGERSLDGVRAAPMIAASNGNGRSPRVFIAGGWFDAVVPFAIAHRLDREGAFGECDVELRNYPAGHMIYVDEAAHTALVDDLGAWFDRRMR